MLSLEDSCKFLRIWINYSHVLNMQGNHLKHHIDGISVNHSKLVASKTRLQ